MTPILTGRRAPRIAVVLAAGLALIAGRDALCAQDVAALGEQLAGGESRTVRLKAALALGRSGDPAALEHLFPAVDDEDAAVRKSAAVAITSVLRASGEADPARLVVGEALSADLSPGGQMEVVGILDKLSPPKGAARAIVRFLDRGDLSEEAAMKCVRTLSKERYAEFDVVRDSLLDLVETGETSVATAAAAALGRMRMSESEKEEVVAVLMEQLGLGDDDAPIRESARKSLGIVTGEGDKSTNGWRAWAVEEGYGDPVEAVPEDELEAERPPVVFPSVETGTSSIVSTLIYVVVGTVATALVVILLILRSAYTKRSAKAIDAKRRKIRRRA